MANGQTAKRVGKPAMRSVNGSASHGQRGEHGNGRAAMLEPAWREGQARGGAEVRTVRSLEPTGREVMLGLEDIIVSKTDLTGKIIYANDVFNQIAGFVESEVIGQPHAFIRHPDMPRCVFKLLWDSIQSGKEIFAYVVNMTKTGDHYWVFAHVTPSVDERGAVVGYHSNRRSPDRAAIDKVRALYSRLSSIERQHSRKADAIAASMQELERVVGEKHASYEEFVFSL